MAKSWKSLLPKNQHNNQPAPTVAADLPDIDVQQLIVHDAHIQALYAEREQLQQKLISASTPAGPSAVEARYLALVPSLEQKKRAEKQRIKRLDAAKQKAKQKAKQQKANRHKAESDRFNRPKFAAKEDTKIKKEKPIKNALDAVPNRKASFKKRIPKQDDEQPRSKDPKRPGTFLADLDTLRQKRKERKIDLGKRNEATFWRLKNNDSIDFEARRKKSSSSSSAPFLSDFKAKRALLAEDYAPKIRKANKDALDQKENRDFEWKEQRNISKQTRDRLIDLDERRRDFLEKKDNLEPPIRSLKQRNEEDKLNTKFRLGFESDSFFRSSLDRSEIDVFADEQKSLSAQKKEQEKQEEQKREEQRLAQLEERKKQRRLAEKEAARDEEKRSRKRDRFS